MKQRPLERQMGFSMAEDRRASFERQRKKRTRREVFLAQMESLVPWGELCTLIEPHYPKAGNGRPPIGLERMLRIHFLQHWFSLADEAVEDALYDSAAFRTFVGLDFGDAGAPDATTVLKFRHLLEQHKLGEALFARVNAYLTQSGIKVGSGTIVDATIIAAPTSTKNKDKQRDEEMHQTKKGNQWYFGMKLHVGADSQSGVVHSAEVTAANVHDSTPVGDLLHGKERRLYGDSAYRGAAIKERVRKVSRKVKDFTNERAYRNRELSKTQKRKNTYKSGIRAKVEYPFLVIKKLWGFTKTRYRGLMKNKNRLLTTLALANLYIVRARLLPRTRAVCT